MALRLSARKPRVWWLNLSLALAAAPLGAACSDSSPVDAHWPVDAGADVSPGLGATQRLSIDAQGASLLSKARDAFRVTVVPHPAERDTSSPLVLAAIQRGEAQHFELVGGALVPVFREGSGPRPEVQPSKLKLPQRANDAFKVSSRGVKWAVRPSGARPAPARAAGDALVYEGAFDGAMLLHVPLHTGTEEYVRFASRPERASLSYEVHAEGAAGYRLVEGVLEVLTADGTPVLRTQAPLVFDSAGQVRRGEIALEGCRYDSDPLPPWGRAVTPPGSDVCTVVTRWSDDGLTYPILVDPAWTSTDDLITKRYGHSASRFVTTSGACTGGCVLATAGRGASGTLTSAELYSESTKTWTSVAALPGAARAYHAGAALTGMVLVAGGTDPATNAIFDDAYVYSPSSGWTPAGVWGAAYARYSSGVASITNTNSGVTTVYVTGGLGADANPVAFVDIYTSPPGSWSFMADMTTPRARHAAEALSIGGGVLLLLAGGQISSALEATASVEMSIAGGAWTEGAPLPKPVYDVASTRLYGTEAIIAGGRGPAGESSAFSRIRASRPTETTLLGLQNVGSYQMAAAAHRSGSYEGAIFTGGSGFRWGSGPVTGLSESVVVSLDRIVGVAAMRYRRTEHRAVTLGNGDVLAVGGYSLSGMIFSYAPYDEVFSPSANGSACSNDAECFYEHCVDGVCCNEACTDLCKACATAKTGAANGTCANITTGTDPDGECPNDGASTCDRDGTCANGACRLYSSGTACGTDSCANGLESHPRCDGYGACLSQTKSCGLFACSGSSCRTTCSSDGDCIGSAWCSGTTCAADMGLGSGCTRAAQCTSGSCADGFCCDSACTNTCMACSASLKASGGDGVCGPIQGGTDPKNQCNQQSASTCGTSGSCDGAGACAYWADGTSCGTNTCSNGTATAYQCNGLGSCLTSSAACTPYICGASACLSACSSDAQCASGYYCTSSQCVAKRANGLSCSAAGQCASGNCVDGFCCDTACSGVCMACSAIRKGGGADGICGPIAQGTDPQNECTDGGAASCGTNGFCSGTGACQLYAAGASCGTASCSLGSRVEHVCNGLGTCNTVTTACSPYACSGTACATQCTTDAECAPAYYCRTSDKTCQADLVNGSACTSAGQCASGSCVDGVCCDTACAGPCMACSAALKGGSSPNGVCGPINAGTDPQNECTAQATSTCGTTGTCDGSGACAFHPLGTACGATICANGQQTGFACNGLGTCVPSSTSICAPYVCKGATCATTCSVDGDCLSNYYCRVSDHTCQPDQAAGTACTSGSQCASGNCADGVCCDTACASLCEACTAAKKGGGVDGVCGNVAAGQDPDNECSDQGAATCGTNGTCSGLGSCAYYPQGTACGSTTCADDIQTGSACNGAGTCNPASTTPCAPFKCAGTACGSSCNDDSNCAPAYYCRISDHTCQPDQANGSPCTGNGQCSSTNCVDGVCCDTVCQGTCMACTKAKKGGGTDGACGPAASGTDPDNECDATSANTCGTNGQCNGTGACAFHAAGTACGVTTCSNGQQTGKACNGSGTCQDAQTTSCAPYYCNGSACATSCIQTSDCIESFYCRMADHTCQLDQAAGGACSAAEECKSGYCIDGFCCDTGCQGPCLACSAAKKGQGSDGICGPVAAQTDPDNDCNNAGASSCHENGYCDGAGACALYAAGTPCGVTSCSSGVQTGQACNGAGDCIGSQTVPCAPYVCSGNACAPKCFSDADCVASHYCDAADQQCHPDQLLGAPCASASQCHSGSCADGVCCDTSCEGICQACTAAKKGGGSDGACGNVPDATDPDNDCTQDLPATCGYDGYCNGLGECRFHAAGVSCGDSACLGNVAKGDTCNGQGTCVPDSGGTDCSPYLCMGSGCANPCASDAHCLSGYYCEQGQCLKKGVIGAACADDAACDSGFCADGICCNNQCPGQCEACNVPGSEGTCLPVTGQPRAGKPACGGQGDCASQCDGTNRTSCTFPGSAVSCGTTCTNGALIVSSCDGNGQCLAGPPATCFPYTCESATACKTTCTIDDDCMGGAVCNASHECEGGSAPDAATGTGGSGGGGTGGTGGTNTDAGATAPPAATPAPDEGGCGCRVGERSEEHPIALLGALAALAIGLQRSRKRPAVPGSSSTTSVQRCSGPSQALCRPDQARSEGKGCPATSSSPSAAIRSWSKARGQGS